MQTSADPSLSQTAQWSDTTLPAYHRLLEGLHSFYCMHRPPLKFASCNGCVSVQSITDREVEDAVRETVDVRSWNYRFSWQIDIAETRVLVTIDHRTKDWGHVLACAYRDRAPRCMLEGETLKTLDSGVCNIVGQEVNYRHIWPEYEVGKSLADRRRALTEFSHLLSAVEQALIIEGVRRAHVYTERPAMNGLLRLLEFVDAGDKYRLHKDLSQQTLIAASSIEGLRRIHRNGRV